MYERVPNELTTASATPLVLTASRRGFLRVLVGGIGLSITGGLLAACGGSGTPTSAPSATAAPTKLAPGNASVAASQSTPGMASATARAGAGASPSAMSAAPAPELVSAAKKEGAVQLYTSLDTKIVEAIIKPFKDKYGIDVKYYRGGSADVSSKVLSEADAGKVQADVVDASDVGAFIAMKQKGLLEPYESPNARGVPANLRDADSVWVADRLTQAVIQFNTQLVPTPPKRWKDLIGQQYGGKLVYFSASNGDGAPRLYTLAKELGWELLDGLAATKPLRVQTPQIVTQTLENGERTVGFVQNDNLAWRSKQLGKPTDYLYPDEGVPVELGAVGLIKNANNPNAGKLFYDWWMGDEGQKLLVDGGKYSSRADLVPPKGAPPLNKLKLLVLDYAEYQSKRAEILARMAKIFGGEWGQ